MLRPQKVDEKGWLLRFLKNGLSLIFHNPLTFTAVFLLMGAVSYVSFVTNSQFLLLCAEFFFVIFIFEICYGSSREKYTPKKFIVSLILSADFLKKLIKEKNMWIFALFFIVIGIDVVEMMFSLGVIDKPVLKPQLNPDGTMKEIKEQFFFLKEWMPFFSITLYILPLFVARYDTGRLLSDDYYSYRYEGAFQKEEARAYSPTGLLNKSIAITLQILALLLIVLPISLIVIKCVGSVILVLMMAQYSLEAYGDDGLKKKQEQEKEKEIENLVPDNT